MYVNRGDGGKAQSAELVSWMETCRDLARQQRFFARAGQFYSVCLWFTMPSWQSDIDNRIKPTLDGLFGSRDDQRIIRLLVVKRVEPGVERTTARVIEVRKGDDR